MNNKDIIEDIQNYLNNMALTHSFEVTSDMSSLESYYYRTAKRLIHSYDLWKSDNKFWDDFLIALRDYLLLFETSIQLDNILIPSDNSYAIKKNNDTGRYFASFQFPNGVNDYLATQAYMRDIPKKLNNEKKYNLMTDSLIYNITGFKYFKSLAQKLAVYGALKTPEGYTTLVSLPTGGGKSLITQTLGYQTDGLTIVVVPTVSLADDQVISAKNIVKNHDVDKEIFAYHSGIDIMPILTAINEKTARLLFISPESLLNNQGFEQVIKTANQHHYLKNIVVDEAHIVIDWGASFRVDYQCLEAWRRKLLISNPSIRTILLSATFENKCVEILKKLFSDGDHWIEVRCDSLRHEPRYMLLQEKNYKAKDKKTLELIQKLPHPMIVYVARPLDAERIKDLLQNHGINNVYTYTGATKREQREKILKDWKADNFSIMIATSAFGVGVDKPDVRTVVHQYIPQNPNAYYQELGRGGRDKLPCLSVMCTYPDDLHITFQRINKRVMTSEKILSRWDSMYNNKASIRDGSITYINTAIKPNYHTTDEWDDAPTSDADMNWNIYVLLLFRRYGLINIVSITIDAGVYTFAVEIVNELLRQKGDEQDSLIEGIRAEEWDYYNDAYRTMETAIKENKVTCWSEMFFDTYDKVGEHCSGCNAHDRIDNSDVQDFDLKMPIRTPRADVKIDQKAIFESQNEMVVIASDVEKINLIKKFDQMRMHSIISDNQQLEELDYYGKINSRKNTLIIGIREAKELLKTKNYYYVSGMIMILYPEDEKGIMDLYRLVNKYLSHKEAVYLIHVLKENSYLSSLGKNFTDLINGRVISVDALCK